MIVKPFRKTFSQIIILPLRKYIFNEKYKAIILFIIIGLLASDIFLSSNASDIKFYGITIFFFITAFFYQLKSRVTFIICLVLFCIMYLDFLISGLAGPSKITEKVAVWLFLFMLVGILQQWKE